jgi:hypothetical protein
MDPDLVRGIIAALGSAVAVLGWAARRMVANFDTIAANNTLLVAVIEKNTARVESVEKSNLELKAAIVELKTALHDRRQEDATKASLEQTTVTKTTIAIITGKHGALSGEQAEEAVDDPTPPSRRKMRAGSHPGG